MSSKIASTSGTTRLGAGSVGGRDDLFGVQALGVGNALLLVDAGEDNAGRQAEAGDKIGFENLAAQRVGARLKDCPEARVGIDRAQGAEGFANGGWMVREISMIVTPPIPRGVQVGALRS